MAALRLSSVTCTGAGDGGPHGGGGQGRLLGRGSTLVGYPSPVLTVLSWFAARRSRKSLRDIVSGELRPAPTLLAMLSDRYTNEDNLRPFAPLAEQLGDRMHVFLLAEWPQDERERDGDALLRAFGLAAEARPLLLRDG